GDRGERAGRVADVAPHERGAEAQGDVVRAEICARGVGDLDVDQLLEPGGGDSPPALVGEHPAGLDSVDPAAECLRENDRWPTHAAGDVEHAVLRPETEVVAGQADLLGARRVLDLLVAVDELVPGGHAARLQPTRSLPSRR